jgi:hypothetical protein
VIERLAEQIWARNAFQAEYESLITKSLRRSLANVTIKDESDLDEGAIARLVQSATHLAGSKLHEHREAAYRIATASYEMYGQQFDNIRDICTFVLGRLGNYPASAFVNNPPEKFEQSRDLPDHLWLDYHRHRLANTVAITQTDSLTFTDFQRTLWDRLEGTAQVSISAPTSAGKSFALLQFMIGRVLASGANWGMYLVPTRALINQVSADIASVLNSYYPKVSIVRKVSVGCLRRFG